VSGCSLCTGKGKGEQEDLGNAEHRQEAKGRWTVKQASRLERRKRAEHCPRRETKGKESDSIENPGRIAHPYISAWPIVVSPRRAADLLKKWDPQACHRGEVRSEWLLSQEIPVPVFVSCLEVAVGENMGTGCTRRAEVHAFLPFGLTRTDHSA
jgi:hypothetical protein